MFSPVPSRDFLIMSEGEKIVLITEFFCPKYNLVFGIYVLYIKGIFFAHVPAHSFLGLSFSVIKVKSLNNTFKKH